MNLFQLFNVNYLIYKPMVLPYIDYGNTVYFLCTNDLLNKLQRMQNRAFKIIFRFTEIPDQRTTSDHLLFLLEKVLLSLLVQYWVQYSKD